MYSNHRHRAKPVWLIPAFLVLTLSLLLTGFTSVAAQSKDKGGPPNEYTGSTQVINGSPMVITVRDNTQLGIRFTNTAIGLNGSPQFYSDFADGVFMWVQNHGTKVFGPASIPSGHNVYAYTPVSQSLTGVGTPANPWVVTTVNDVAGTKLRLTQVTSYVNNAEFVKMKLTVQQIQGTQPEQVTIFHAADLESGGGSTYGYFNSTLMGVGGYYTTTAGTKIHQQFISTTPMSAHQEGRFEEIWDAIGDISGPGPGFNNICQVNQPLDAGMGLQWNLNVPASGAVTVADSIFISPHTNIAGSFSDVSYGTFYYEPVYYLATQGMLSGYNDTSFRPVNNTTRGQAAKMVVLSERWTLYTPAVPTFKDVPQDNPFYAYIETAFHHGAISGYEDNTFRWGNDITRAQFAKVIVLAEGWDLNMMDGPHFIDVPNTHPFYAFIETAYNKHLISGYSDGTFRPTINATRAQISKMIYESVQFVAPQP